MFKIENEVLEWGGKTLTIETGRVARQAHGSVIATYGGTSVLATVVADHEPKPGLDFFPLTVNYQEKAYAAGKIPGGFFKREGRPSEKETLVSRLIDRPIRPLFAKGFQNETQVIATVISYDGQNDADIVALVAVSAALTLSGVPFMGPIAAARVGYIEGEYILNPTKDELDGECDLDLVVAGTNTAVLMVESEAKELSEDVMLGAVSFGQESFKPVIEAIISLAEKAAKEPRELIEVDLSDLQKTVNESVKDKLIDAYKESDKQARSNKISDIKNELLSEFSDNEDLDVSESDIKSVFKNVEKDIVRGSILDTGLRIDGRDLETVRPVQSDVSILPLTHGSALFTRGETQALVVTTLGTGLDEKFVDGLDETYKEKFMLHYNFPPYSVGETGRTGFTSRREIGHGKLAWRSLQAVLPEYDDFPYTIRLVSEITESNGSSSMATVCGSSLSLMDAGVPLKRPVAGIAMGLIKEGDRVAVLSDILGDEDHLGDMDFKVAGTADGITSLQMDIKITGITKEIMDTALTQAKDGRNHILAEMAKAIETGRETVNSTAPRIETIQVPVDKIRDVIGSGGKVIREIVEESGAKVDINDDGIVKVASNDTDSLNKALELINSIVAEPEAGEIYEGKVVKIMDFGAFVNFFGKKDGLVHISQLANERVNNVTDVVNEGDIVKVKLVGFDNRGKVKLSMKDVDQKTGKEISSDKLGNNTANDSKPKDDSKPKKEKKPRKKKTEDKKDKE
ncbi:MAG: polyribonucleotide nucleotidyltransferase [Hyphomicrobiales bacterium]|jgi:polyribonucleotide nucleotidyltransferase|nr:polyribonucleotide nucleotidyltransferase [Hyphomicrobiales bacterium]MDG1664165.1 polyribonucleotide nucleotidyltransferase [Hyphomicrobiales bacterium]MDG2413984.1 polyribonucleotide nucleotidyltransferase [Hyphomicrobiales bacterium]|tara:strand:+ start:1 stop:2223 length:2223 start_codon:yes stop_codon:yes gene_type:complete